MANVIKINGKDVKDAKAAKMASIAPVEATSTASSAHDVGEYFWLAGVLYEATSAIAIGDSIASGTNCKVAVLGDDVTDLKSQMDAVNDYLEDGIWDSGVDLSLETGNIKITDGTNTNNAAEQYKRTTDYIPIEKLVSITLIRPTSSYYNYYYLYNSDKTFIFGENYNSGVVPFGNAAFVRLSGYKSGGLTEEEFRSCFTVVVKPSYIDDQLQRIDEDISNLNTKTVMYDDVIIGGEIKSESVPVDNSDWINGYVDQNGNTSTSSTLMHSPHITVQPGDELEIRSSAGGVDDQRNIRFVAAYNENAFVSSASGQNINAPAKYIVPNGVTSVIVSTSGQAGSTAYTNRRVIVYHSDAHGWLKPEPLGKWRFTGDLSDGQALVVPENNVKNQKVMTFSAIIGAFDKIQIGRTLDGTYEDWRYFEIDSTNVTLYDNAISPPTTASYAHGLTIENTIQIKITTTNTNALAEFEIVSNGQRVNVNNMHVFGWIGDQGMPFVRSDGSTLTGCVMSWTSRNINKPIWIFGDSYMSLYDVRWPYYLIEDGYDVPCILNAYAGEASKKAIVALKNLLQIARPQYIVWLMGMNDPDPDSDTKVNDNWKYCYDVLIEYCDAMGITPILSTIPNVPTQINTWKNDIVRASGYRYIDMAKAVGAEEKASTWYAGMLSSDRIHPTAAGAIAEYYQLLTDFPEITALS